MKALEIAEFLNGELVGDGAVEIERVASFITASVGEIAFVEKAVPMIETTASCVIVPTGFDGKCPAPIILVKNPKLAFSLVAAILHGSHERSGTQHPSAVISERATIGRGVFLGALAFVGDLATIGDGTHILAGAKIGDNVSIGKNCVIHPNVVINDGTMIGDNVLLHAGVVVGADGFGYVPDEKGNHIKFPQIGTVVIEDDVEIGANSCVDRGALGETRIGMGTKIDNLVQIAHNVQIGKRVIIAAQTGISGSTVIEDDCIIGGQVGIADHVLLKSGTVIGSKSAVMSGKIVRPGVWLGLPIQPIDEFKRQYVQIKGISKLKDEVKLLRQKIDELSGGIDEL